MSRWLLTGCQDLIHFSFQFLSLPSDVAISGKWENRAAGESISSAQAIAFIDTYALEISQDLTYFIRRDKSVTATGGTAMLMIPLLSSMAIATIASLRSLLPE